MERSVRSDTQPARHPGELPRLLGLKDVVGIVVGTMIGSGIFIVPAAVANAVKAPLVLLLVWVVGGILTFFGALSLAELGAAYPYAGGMYVFLREAYGRLAAFLFGWTLFLIIDSGSMATLAVAFSSKYLPQFVRLSPAGTRVVAVSLVVVLALINYIGVKWGALVQNLLTLIKVGALVGVGAVVFAFARGNPRHFVTPAVPPFSISLVGAIGVGLVAALWALKGWEMATFSAGEIRRPERNLPRGILFGTFLVIVLYLGANLAYLYAVPIRDLARSSRIASDAMGVAVGPVGASIIALAILLSIAGAANSHVLTGPRVYFAMARDGLFFRKVGRVHPRFLTPHVSILALGLWSALLCLTGTFEQLFTFVVFGLWIFFGLTVGAVIILRRKRPELARPYRTWGYPFTPALFVLAALFISVNTLINKFWNSFAGLLIIALGLPAYFYWRRKEKKDLP
jgi:APA family basic amino acid/polyamine antiporter